MTEQLEAGCLPEVDLLNWANDLVGTVCLRCETEIAYHSLGSTNGQREHRVECDCTLIESVAKT